MIAAAQCRATQGLLRRGEPGGRSDQSDFYKYAHHVAAHTKGALQPKNAQGLRRYKHVDYYDSTLFGRTYDWMKARGLTEGQSEHSAFVVG